jgi:acetyltransferase-like isoleucine patch superfamily enzyme
VALPAIIARRLRARRGAPAAAAAPARAFGESIVDPRAWLHLLRLVHFYNYSHVTPRRRMQADGTVRISPTVSLRSGERITVGRHTAIGERCHLWAGGHATITIGERSTFAPSVFVTVVRYGTRAGLPIRQQPWEEHDVVIGDDVWLGAGVVVLPGVTIGDGSVVGAGSIVSRPLPANCIAVGVPARIIAYRHARSATGRDARA